MREKRIPIHCFLLSLSLFSMFCDELWRCGTHFVKKRQIYTCGLGKLGASSSCQDLIQAHKTKAFAARPVVGVSQQEDIRGNGKTSWLFPWKNKTKQELRWKGEHTQRTCRYEARNPWQSHEIHQRASHNCVFLSVSV